MATAQGRNGHSRLIDWNTFGTQDTRQNDFLAITFSKDDQPGKVDFGVCLNGFADKLVGFICPFWQANACGLGSSLTGEPQIAYVPRIDSPKHGRCMGGDQGLGIFVTRHSDQSIHDSSQIVR